jgi:hypothetical protein
MKDFLEFLNGFTLKDSKSQVIVLLVAINLALGYLSVNLYNSDINLYETKSKNSSENYSSLEKSLREEHAITVNALLKENTRIKTLNSQECDSLVNSTLATALANYKKLYKRVSELEQKLFIANEKIKELDNRVHK